MQCANKCFSNKYSLTSYGAEEHILFDVCVDIVIALRLEWRPGRKDGVEGGEVVCLPRVHSSFFKCPQPLSSSTKNSDPNV